MAKTATRTSVYSLQGDGMNVVNTFTSQNLAGVVPTSVNTVNGSLTVTVPAAAAGFSIVPPSTSSVTKTLKGVAGDTGLTWASGSVLTVPLVPGALASFVITATAVETLEIFWL